MAVTSYVRPDGAIVETDPNWTPGGYVVPASERGAPVASINLAPVPQQKSAATLQAAAGRDVPMIRRDGVVMPATPLYNNGRPATAAWSIDPINGSVAPLVGAYSAYPHVVYAPQYLGAAGLLDVVSRAVANNPYAQQAMMLAAQGGGRIGGGSGTGGGRRSAPSIPVRPGVAQDNLDIRTSVDRPAGQRSEEEEAIMNATRALEVNAPDVFVGPPRPSNTALSEVSRVEDIPPQALDNAANTDPNMIQRLEENPVATAEEQAMANNALRLFAGTGLAAYTGALMRDEAVRKFGEYAGGRMGWSRFLATPQGRTILRGALGRMVATGAIPLAVASAVKNVLDYGESQGMNLEGWNTSDDMAMPEGF